MQPEYLADGGSISPDARGDRPGGRVLLRRGV